MEGSLTDDGLPVSLATVVILDANKNILVKTTQSDSRGRYRFSVGEGNYKLRASIEEYADEWVRGLVVRDKSVVVNITMSPQVFLDSSVVSVSDGCE